VTSFAPPHQIPPPPPGAYPKDPAVLARMRELRTSGLSYRATADALNAAGIPPQLGARWYPNVVRRILLRTAPKAARRIA
jgi:hypothetical protein